MNERIKELAEQAGSTHKQSLGVYQFYADELEKFAELIVRECIVGLENNYPPDDLLPIEEVTGFLKEHFGVE